ncbi:Aste57867_1280 [Aphanomyces stellatus]|uniref:Aste57867_1280 protein n=1 Tax=Aphanomyces stellatus TaxID=120398 RepID=A0A485K4S0_9STRA|nr:hypothetical protein As57867_001279 [Aphanomyces stellatus]VFT78499.1 Aste57867_1280 [Aphanomyces stellatus]
MRISQLLHSLGLLAYFTRVVAATANGTTSNSTLAAFEIGELFTDSDDIVSDTGALDQPSDALLLPAPDFHDYIQPWMQCGGKEYTGGTLCAPGYYCAPLNDYYSQCQLIPGLPGVPLYEQCGGRDYVGDVVCQIGATCVVQNDWYAQCRPLPGLAK